jgi:hypothetical protein
MGGAPKAVTQLKFPKVLMFIHRIDVGRYE